MSQRMQSTVQLLLVAALVLSSMGFTTPPVVTRVQRDGASGAVTDPEPAMRASHSASYLPIFLRGTAQRVLLSASLLQETPSPEVSETPVDETPTLDLSATPDVSVTPPDVTPTPEPSATPPDVTPTPTATETPTGTIEIDDLIPPDLSLVTASKNPQDDAEEKVTIGPSGAAVSFLEGHLTLIVDANTFSEDVEVTLHKETLVSQTITSTQLVSTSQGFLPITTGNPDEAPIRFTLDAKRVSDKEEVDTFGKPVQLVLDLRDLIDTEGLPGWYIAYQDESDAALWHYLDVTAHDKSGLISVETEHFSSWASGAEPGSWHFRWNVPTVSTFSGAATYQHAIEVPAGRNGLQPNVDISYSSRGVDSHILSNMDQGPLGLGWSIEQIEISRNGAHIIHDGVRYRMLHPDSFSMVLNGQSYVLTTTENTGNATVRYYASGAPQLFVQRIYSATAPNSDHLYWAVKTPDGTTYRLGYTGDSELIQSTWPAEPIVYGHTGNPTYPKDSGLRWWVDTITDVYGNQIQYDYYTWSTTDVYSNEPGHQSEVTSEFQRLSEIRYNYANLAANPNTRATGTYASRIQFVGTADGKRIDEIRLYQVDVVNPYRRYDIGLDALLHTGCGQSVHTDRVTFIQQKNGAGTAVLPVTTMSYTALDHAWACYVYDYLQEVNNGYGGRTKFTYWSDNRKSHGFACDCIPDYGFTYFVIKTETWDGIHAQPGAVDYTFETPCYDQLSGDLGALAGAFNCPTRDPIPGVTYGNGALVGFARTTITSKDYDGTVLGKDVTEFHQSDPNKVGRPSHTEAQTPAGVILQRSDPAYTTQTVGPIKFTFVHSVTQTAVDGGVSKSKVTTYAYATAQQSNAQYGNLTEQIEYDENGQPYRRTRHEYYPNTTAWIVNKSGYENIDEWTGSTWSLVSSTWYSYDGHTWFNVAVGNKGELSAVRRWAGGTGGSLVLVDTRYTYDAWGNRLTESTYDNYGVGATYASTNPKTTTAQYDTQFHLYPLTVTLPLAMHVTKYEYYGVNGVPLSGYTSGLLKKVTDPNGNAITYTYDTFGRLYEVYKPGDGTDPSLRYTYWDNGAFVWVNPFMISVNQKPNSSLKLEQRHFYDGLGREIQTHTNANATLSGYATKQDVLVSSRYDSRGLVVSQTVPYAVSAYVWNGLSPYTTVGASAAPRTLTTYDALGRETVITAPDGTLAKHYYGVDNDTTVGIPGGELTNNRLHSTVDGNGHAKHYVQDAFGRLIIVRDFSGICHPTSPGCTAQNKYVVYATTRYGYDVLGNMTRVTDTLGSTTAITYNVLGQKIGMRDPDMGVWKYEYDVAGNLITQTDAINHALWFKYDKLNRLVEKHQTNMQGASLVTYTYDSGTNGIGQRGWVLDPSGWLHASFDTRGRVVTESRYLNSLGIYTTTYAYDLLDRVTMITTPNGEVVTQTYNNLGALENVRSQTNGVWLVNNLDYTAQGQVALMGLGNGLTTNYTYWANNFRLKTNVTGAVQNLSYLYDKVGNATRITDTVSFGSSQTQVFGYDALDRLTSASATGGTGGTYSHSYTYNQTGNFVSMAGTNHVYNATVSGCVAGTPSPKPHAVSAAGTNSYTYDCNGNMLTRNEGGTSYTQAWDWENRLTSVTSGGQTTSFTYDGDGARVKKVEPGNIITLYIGPTEINLNATNRITKTYYSAGAQMVAMRVVTSTGGNTLYYLHTDHLGSTSLSTCGSGGCGTAGALVAGSRQSYYPYGAVRTAASSLPTDITFTGQRSDASTGLMFYNARYYDPVVGRFVSADTIVPGASNPQAFNRYSYVYNRPLILVDPSGHIAEDQVNDANDIVDELKWTYDIEINADWYGSGKDFHRGVWELFELTAVRDAVRDMANVLGGATAFKGMTPNDVLAANGGWLKITRVRESGGGEEFKGEIRLRNGVFTSGASIRDKMNIKTAVVHEIGHAWDYGSNYLVLNRLLNMNGPIVDGLTGFVQGESSPTWYGATDIREDWAESVAAFVYPNYTASLQSDAREAGRSTAGSPRPGLGPLHYSYVAIQILRLPGGRDYLDPGGTH